MKERIEEQNGSVPFPVVVPAKVEEVAVAFCVHDPDPFRHGRILGPQALELCAVAGSLLDEDVLPELRLHFEGNAGRADKERGTLVRCDIWKEKAVIENGDHRGGHVARTGDGIDVQEAVGRAFHDLDVGPEVLAEQEQLRSRPISAEPVNLHGMYLRDSETDEHWSGHLR